MQAEMAVPPARPDFYVQILHRGGNGYWHPLAQGRTDGTSFVQIDALARLGHLRNEPVPPGREPRPWVALGQDVFCGGIDAAGRAVTVGRNGKPIRSHRSVLVPLVVRGRRTVELDCSVERCDDVLRCRLDALRAAVRMAGPSGRTVALDADGRVKLITRPNRARQPGRRSLLEEHLHPLRVPL